MMCFNNNLKGAVAAVCFLLGFSLEIYAQKLVVVSRWEDKVLFIDVSSGKTYNSIKTGSFPHEIASDPENQFAYIPSYAGNRITKIDLKNEKLIAHFELGEHKNLHGVELSNDGKSLWITSEEQRAVIKVNTETGTVLESFSTLQYRSHMLTVIPDETKIYASNLDSGSVSIMNTSTKTTKVLHLGNEAEGIDHTPDGKEIWVTNRAENTVSVINTNKDEILKTFPSNGSFPVKLKFSPDGTQVWICNNRSGTVAVFNASTYSLIKLIETGNRPLGIAFSDDNKFAYITKPGAHEVVEINIEDDFQITRLFEAEGSPDGIIWLPY
ncbi:YncE family protein [Gracilimonas sp.]|uniref:YncE family protein n=1 Tax=Gracilimonas sp. TaxID=1974203 RepID=UPI0032EDDC92